MQLGRRSQCVSGEIFFCGNKLHDLVFLATLLFEAENLDLSVIGDEKILRAEAHVPVRVVLEDVLDLGASDLAVLNLDDVEPARVVLSFIELKHKVLIEDVPTDHIIYLIQNDCYALIDLWQDLHLRTLSKTLSPFMLYT